MSESENEDTKNVTEEFVEIVKTWVKIDDEIRDKTKQIKELKDDRKEYETFILNYMEKIDENVINISDGKLRKNKSTTKGGLKQEIIQNALLDMTQDSNKAVQMTKYIMEKRPITERVNLKRTKNRGKRTAKKNI